jgi:hypothetical protein
VDEVQDVNEARDNNEAGEILHDGMIEEGFLATLGMTGGFYITG